MNFRISYLVFFLYFCSPLYAGVCADSKKDDTHYNIQVSFSDPLTVHVDADVRVADRKLYMDPFGDDDLLDGWATFVRNLQVTDGNGRLIDFQRSGRATWHLESDFGSVHLRYDVDITAAKGQWPLGNLRYAKFLNNSLYVVNRILFIVSDVAGPKSVTFEVPAHWTISSSLQPIDSKTFSAVDNRDLLLNSTTMGEQNEFRIEDRGFHLIIVTPEKIETKRMLSDATRRILHAYMTMFPKTPPRTYTMTFFYGKDDDGESFSRSSAFTTTDEIKKDNFIIWGNFIAHELFHHWNGQQIRGKDVNDRQWFNEGFTEYFANKTLAATRLISRDLFIKKMERHLGMYAYFRVAPPFQGISLKDAGKRKGYNRPGVYSGGWAVALCLDVEIQKGTRRRKDLADFMRAMYDKFGLSNNLYSYDDLVETASAVSGKDESGFFKNYVEGTQMLPWKEALLYEGLQGFSKNYAGEVYIFRKLGKNR
jgi:predicted metalloprotease with PDZ domain